MHINKVKIQANWTFLDEQGNNLPPLLFDLLSEIKHNSKLTKAAQNLGMSYRGAWNLINKSTLVFGMPLVELHRGRGTKLTALGEKLLWSKHRVAARLGPQLDNLTSELNIEIQQILTDVSPKVSIHASHGYAVALLPRFAKNFQLDLQYKSIEESLAALQRGDCDLAGFDVPTQFISPNMKTLFRQYLNPNEHVIISFVLRQQGLLVQQGNPKNIQQIMDLIRPDIKFINRQKESGTRALLDELLFTNKVAPEEIQGFADEEYTHTAVAAFIAAGMADVGLGIEAAASHFGLHFIPVAKEHYLFACKKHTLKLKAIEQLLSIIKSPPFTQEINTLPGYTPDFIGKIKQIPQVFKWL